jgi:TPR repeat protein
MTFVNPKTSLLVEASLLMLEIASRSNSALDPWCKALVALKGGDVEAASEIASKAFNNGASLAERESVIDMINMVAFENDRHGHWFETLLIQAAESGLGTSAYNVGNLITGRASSPADHALASRYYTLAAKIATDPKTKASALVNSCVPIRDGFITGKPDWIRAVEIYEEAAELNLAVGMFNAANVSCWLKDKGNFAYAARAVKWLTKLISGVEAGATFVDIGGDAEVREVYSMAKVRLAELHAMDQVERVDVDLILEVAAAERCKHRAAWLKGHAIEHRLRKTELEAKPAAWENWLSVLTVLGWELESEPNPLNLGPGSGDSRLLKFKREKGAPLALAVVDREEIESNDGVYRLTVLASSMRDELDGPCLAIGSKGLFISMTTPEGDKSYTVLMSATDDGMLDLVPIWPGATTDDVADLMEEDGLKYFDHNADQGNTIAILANALGTGRKIDGEHFPAAIYVNVGSFFNTPVFTVEQGVKLGSKSAPAEIEKALKDVNEYFCSLAQQKRKYLGSQLA